MFIDIWTGKAPDMSFMVNNHYYSYGYYLRDVIYPDYATFVKAYTHLRDVKAKLFTERKESARKDIERALSNETEMTCCEIRCTTLG